MHDADLIPEDLELCQRLLREALAVQSELRDTCESLHERCESFRQENEDLQLRIKTLLNHLYGRRSERFVEGCGQLHLAFCGDEPGDFDPSIISALDSEDSGDSPADDDTKSSKKKKNRKRRNEALPAHYERRTERFEPELPPGVRLEDCTLIGVDVVELLEFDPGKPWVRRLEYPKYKLPSWALNRVTGNASEADSAMPANSPADAEPPAEDASTEETVPVADTQGEPEAEAAANPELTAAASHEQDDTHPQASVSDQSNINPEPSPAEVKASAEDASTEETVPVAETKGEPEAEAAANPELIAAAGHEQGDTHPQTSVSDQSNINPEPSPAEVKVSVVATAIEPHGVIQAPRVISLVEGGRFGFSMAAEVIFNKFGQHVPLYRQQDSFAQIGWAPSRSTLSQIVINVAALFAPLRLFFKGHVLATDNIGTDDTPITLLTPREGEGSRKARFWLYRGRDPAPYDVFAFTESRSRDGPDGFLEPFRGILSGDCYSGYVNIEQVTGGRIKFSACLEHSRRYIFNAREQQPILASQMLAQFRQLSDIEDRAATFSPEQRYQLRQLESVPVMNRLRELLDSTAAQRVLPKSGFGKALGYLRNNWAAFQVYLHDGRIPIGNNDVERDLRRIAIGRKNWLFVGSPEAGERSATIYTIVASAHRHDLDVRAYLADALERLAYGRAAAGGDINGIAPEILESLLPDVWAKSHPESVRTFRTIEKQRRVENRRSRRAHRRIMQGTTS